MPETAFSMETLDDVQRLRTDLLKIGYSQVQVAGCVDFLLAKLNGWAETYTAATASRYRKMLRHLLAEQGVPWPPPRKRKRKGGRERSPIMPVGVRSTGRRSIRAA